jgi:hypothetical protein
MSGENGNKKLAPTLYYNDSQLKSMSKLLKTKFDQIYNNLGKNSCKNKDLQNIQYEMVQGPYGVKWETMLTVDLDKPFGIDWSR